MHKAVAVLMLIVVVSMLIAGFIFDKPSRQYALCGKVDRIENDVVSFVDANGFSWSFSGVDDWEIGDGVACVMDDNGTETIFDDEILSVNYFRFF